MLPLIGYVSGFLGLVLTLVAAFFVARSSIKNQTIQAQSELITTLQQKVEALEEADKTKTAEIQALKLEVETFKTVPLSEIVQTQKSILTTQKQILVLLGERQNKA